MILRLAGIFGLILILLPPLPGQVVFSRRVYLEHGPSYQQIWNWNPADNSLKQLTDSQRDHYQPVCSGQHILFVSPDAWQANAKRWSFDRKTRKEQAIGPLPREGDTKPDRLHGCDVAAVAGSLKACGQRGELSISRGGKVTGRVRVGDDNFPIESLSWSPSGKFLLVGTLGVDTNSTSPQSDLFVLQADSMKLVKAGSGNDETWIPGRDDFFYTSPRDMASLAGARRPRGVWVEHLMVFHTAPGKPSRSLQALPTTSSRGFVGSSAVTLRRRVRDVARGGTGSRRSQSRRESQRRAWSRGVGPSLCGGMSGMLHAAIQNPGRRNHGESPDGEFGPGSGALTLRRRVRSVARGGTKSRPSQSRRESRRRAWSREVGPHFAAACPGCCTRRYKIAAVAITARVPTASLVPGVGPSLCGGMSGMLHAAV